MTELSYNPKTLSFAGFTSIAGSISMFAGAALWATSGTDLWQSLASNQMDIYLSQVQSVKQLLVANTSFWIIGVVLLGIAGTLMTEICTINSHLAQVALVCLRSAVPIAIVSFITMLSLTIQPLTLECAPAIGWIGTRLDDLATNLIIGAGPFFLSVAGKIDWVSGWLYVWGLLAGIAGLLGIIGMLTGAVALGFVIIPIGLGWMIAAGIVLIRKSKAVVL